MNHLLVHLQGLEPWTHWLRVSCSTNWAKGTLVCLAGVAGFEPTNDGIKIRCLTAWRHPYLFLWGGRWESNPRPQGPQSCALTNWATPAVLVRLKGFEPLTLGLEGRCSIQLSYRCILFLFQEMLERVMGIGPTQPAWKAGILPLNYTRKLPYTTTLTYFSKMFF